MTLCIQATKTITYLIISKIKSKNIKIYLGLIIISLFLLIDHRLKKYYTHKLQSKTTLVFSRKWVKRIGPLAQKRACSCISMTQYIKTQLEAFHLEDQNNFQTLHHHLILR